MDINDRPADRLKNMIEKRKRKFKAKDCSLARTLMCKNAQIYNTARHNKNGFKSNRPNKQLLLASPLHVSARKINAMSSHSKHQKLYSNILKVHNTSQNSLDHV